MTAAARPSAPALAVARLTPAHRDDFLRFFDHERGAAFADNPDWARCYCHFYHVPRALDWAAMTGDQNRAAMGARIGCGEMDGFLAYAGAEVVGWLNAQPRHKLPHCFDRMRIAPPPLDVPEHEAAAIVCFVVAPAWRRRGVARALLDGALASLATRGIRVVDAFPFNAGESSAATDHYHGPMPLFSAAGFTVLREDQDLTVMRKRLAPVA
jgi:ribosomal protein S18 acetylase RimI-like enzyme